MEENETWEQPNSQCDVQATEVENCQGISSQAEDGSQLGKFKDAQSLLSAYNNLQAEFTKKCQKLSELEKISDLQKSEPVPVFNHEDWTNKVSDFLQKNEDAKNYASEISEFIMNNPEIRDKDDALDLAWAKVVQQKYVAPEKLVSDDGYIQKYIMTNPDIKQKILKEYVKQIQSTTPPPVISVQSGGNIAFAKNKQPITLGEAKSLVEEIFNTKGE